MEKINKKYMQRAIELAKKGIGWVSPNPLVGAVIVKDNTIIGEGYHKEYGKEHAEVNAIEDAEKKGFSVEGATMHVTLEPCTHYGKTPPCTELIIEKKIKKVVIATKDPNTKASGGIEKLQKNGVSVEIGILKKEVQELNKIFFHTQKKKRPYCIIKVAISKNGFITEKENTRSQISEKEAQEFTHHLRQECDAILVGANTVCIDDPELTIRYGENKKNPLRIILDPHNKTPKNAKVYRDENYLIVGNTMSVIASEVKRSEAIPLINSKNNISFRDYFVTFFGKIKKKYKLLFRCSQKNAPRNDNILLLPKEKKLNLHTLLQKLYKKNIHSILIEGGPKTISKFLKADLIDEFITIRSPKIFSEESAVPLFQKMIETGEHAPQISKIPELKNFTLKETKELGEDTAYIFVHS